VPRLRNRRRISFCVCNYRENIPAGSFPVARTLILRLMEFYIQIAGSVAMDCLEILWHNPH